jgi:hypothetical protein
MANLLSTSVTGTVNSTGNMTAAGFTGNANVGGTGAATWHPSGIYSGGTNWLYGTMYLNNNTINNVGSITTSSHGTSANWKSAYDWGNHASAGYLTSLPSHNHDDRYYTETEINNFSYFRDNEDRTLRVLRFTGVGGDSGNSSNHSYAIYQGGGGWSHPYPDLHIGYHTGIKIGANTGYGGTRFYDDSTMVTELFSVGNGDSHVRAANNLYAGALFDAGSRVAISRGEGRNYVDYSRYVYNNGAYSGTGWIEPSDLGVRYAASANYATSAGSAGSASSATSASYARYLPTNYAGGVQSNPQVYFNYEQGLNVAMTGSWSTWSDTLWINGYSGSDVPWMCALHFLRNSEPRMAISAQRRESSGYGSYYEVITAYNIGSQSVNYASSAGSVAWGNVTSKPGIYLHNTWHGNTYIGTGGDIYCTILYDSNNSGYYLDPNGTSRLNRTNYDYVYSYNWVYAEGDVIAFYSDERLKTRVGTIENALDKIKQLTGFYYVNNDLAKSFGYKDEKLQVGLSAQEVQSVLPEVVTLAPFDTEFDENNQAIGSKSGESYLTVSYDKLVPLLIESIKEQQLQIEELKSEVKKLKGE